MDEPVEITPEDSVVPVYIAPADDLEPAAPIDFDAVREARESALSKLTGLGLTEAEIRALFGI